MTLNKGMFLRDTLFYIGMVVVIIIFGIIGEITWWMCLIYMAFYFLYIVIVLYQEKADTNKEPETKKKDGNAMTRDEIEMQSVDARKPQESDDKRVDITLDDKKKNDSVSDYEH